MEILEKRVIQLVRQLFVLAGILGLTLIIMTVAMVINGDSSMQNWQTSFTAGFAPVMLIASIYHYFNPRKSKLYKYLYANPENIMWAYYKDKSKRKFIFWGSVISKYKFFVYDRKGRKKPLSL